MSAALPFEGEPLLVGTFAMAAIGLVVVLLLLRRTASLGRDHAALRATRLAAETGGAPERDETRRWRALLDALPAPAEIRDGRGSLVMSNAGGGAEAPRAWAEAPILLGGQGHLLRVGRDPLARDAAERERDAARDRAEAASEAKSRFIATVSHEFRTPLNGILGMSALLLETALDAEQTTYVQAVRSSAEAFMRLIGDILDFSRIEAGRIEIAEETFDLPALVGGVIELLAPRAQSKGTEIACYVGPDVPRLVRGDADRLRQVLFNLAGNGVKFTAVGGVGVAVERGPDACIRFRIEDTGPGIPAERAERVFEEYERGEPAAAREDGTGLGLAITRRLVERMSGRVGLESTVGEGSCFTLDLPLPAAAGEETGPPRPAPEPRRVLVLSGSPFEGPYIARTLGDAGHGVTVAATLGDALDRMAETPFDVLVADHGLTATDGRIVAREARRHGIAHTVVLLSPFERRDLGSPHAAGFDAYLIKPVRSRSLFERLAPLPAPLPAPQGAPSRSGLPSTARPAGRTRRVLLAEDNAINALLAIKALERLGATVEWVKDGREAAARAEEGLRSGGERYDLILMDIRMPGLDGFGATRRIRSLEGELGLPRGRIVALTASVVGDSAAQVREAGFDRLLSKPFEFAELAAAIGEPEARRDLAS